jgi:6-phosphogluconolactonase (cycloisomerase 2 family)
MRYLCVPCLLLLTLGASAQKRFVYLNNQNQPNNITAWVIDNSNGTLTALAGSPFNTGGQGYQGPIESMAIAPSENGDVLFAANGGDPSVSILRINPGTGKLTPTAGSPFLLNDSVGTYDMAISPNHRFVFVTNEAGTVIHVLGVSPENGSLREVAGSPFAAGDNMSGLWVTASGRFLLASGQTHNAVSVFAILGTGAIAPVAGSPFAANASVSDVRSNCASNLVYTADNGSAYIDAYSMAANGVLTPVPGSPFYNGATGNGPNSFDLALSPNGKFLFASDSFTGSVSSFAVAGNGSLSLVPGSPFFNGGFLGGTTITAWGDFLYSVDFSGGTAGGYAINADGSLTSLGGFGPGQIPFGGEPNSVISYPPPTCPAQ